MLEYLRCQECRFKPYNGQLVRKGYGDNCVLCNKPIEEHEARKARKAREQAETKRRATLRGDWL